MNTLHQLLRKREAAAFYLISYVGTLVLFVAAVLLLNLFPVEIPLHQCAPAFAAIFMIVMTRGKAGLAPFFEGFQLQKLRPKWLGFSLALPLILVGITQLIIQVIQQQSGFLQLDTSQASISVILLTIVGCVGEEIGWRGYFLPLLSQKYGNLGASIILGILWGLWHGGYYGEGVGFLLYVVTTTAMSILMTWLFVKSKGSLLAMIAFHAAVNLGALFLGVELTFLFRLVSCVVFSVPAIGLTIGSSVFRRRGRGIGN